MSGPFATATEFAEWTGMPLPDDLARLQSLLASASSLIRTFCGQELSQVSNDVVLLEPIDRTTLVLPERPVTAVSSVMVDAIAVTDFYFTRAGLLHRGTITGAVGPDWSKGATVTYNHGYAETDSAFGIFRTICIEAVKRAYTFDERGGAIAQGGQLVETIGFPIEVFLSQEEKWALADYGKVLVG